MDNEKYVVFKKEEWDKFEADALAPEPINDAVVIRTQDVFAAAGLSAYCMNMQFYLAMNPLASPELQKAIDYFRRVADEAEDRLSMGQCKIPD